MSDMDYWENILETGDLNPDDHRYALESLLSAMVMRVCVLWVGMKNWKRLYSS